MTKKLSCEEVLSKLYLYLDQEVDTPTRADLEAHIDSCRECFSRAEFENALRNKVASTAELEPPAEVKERLESLIKMF